MENGGAPNGRGGSPDSIQFNRDRAECSLHYRKSLSRRFRRPTTASAMLCEHLVQLERELLASGIAETFRGQAWSSHCREWVYFDCYLDRPAIRARLPFAPCVVDHEHLGTHDGQEAGFVCAECRDAVMGVHSRYAAGRPVFG